MIATQNQSAADHPDSSLRSEPSTFTHEEEANGKVETLAAIVLPSQIITHHPKAGLNPIVDSASYLLSIIGKLKQITVNKQLQKLQQELIQEINHFQENIKRFGYNLEYTVVCRYILCATIDEIIVNTAWGNQGQWDNYLLLTAFNQDAQHQGKFFTIMERAIAEPNSYIDLMELMYICLSLGYKGQYRATEHSQYQLEQITNTLYKHIRAHRGNFSKTLSISPFKATKNNQKRAEKGISLSFIFIVTACFVLALFIGLGYLMDVISNEAYKNLSAMENSVSREA